MKYKAKKDLKDVATQAAGKVVDKASEAGKYGYEVAAPYVEKVVENTLADVEKHARNHMSAKKSVCKRKGRGLFCGATAVTVGAVAYLMWRRSRPVEDPWAKEYWVNLEDNTDLDDVPNETVEEDPQSTQNEGKGDRDEVSDID